jgi:hypothetical protein
MEKIYRLYTILTTILVVSIITCGCTINIGTPAPAQTPAPTPTPTTALTPAPTPLIQLDSIEPKYAGDTFYITGTTNLPDNSQIVIMIEQSGVIAASGTTVSTNGGFRFPVDTSPSYWSSGYGYYVVTASSGSAQTSTNMLIRAAPTSVSTPETSAQPTVIVQSTGGAGFPSVETITEMVQDYHNSHTYLGTQTGQSSNIYVCVDMAKDFWDMMTARGFTAFIKLGNVNEDVTSIAQANHAWDMVEISPNGWLAADPTGGFVMEKENNPLYYTGWDFNTPADLDKYSCGGTGSYCFSGTCINGQCLVCNPGSIMGTDYQCHPTCIDSTHYCLSGSVCGTDNQCHKTCIDSTHYCLSGYVCGADNQCHQTCGDATHYCLTGYCNQYGKCV